MDAAQALKLSQGAIYGVASLTVDEIRERVRSRYPEAAELPGPPELDSLLREAGFEFEWDPFLRGTGGYKSRLTESFTYSSAAHRRCASRQELARPVRRPRSRSLRRLPMRGSLKTGSSTGSKRGRSQSCW